MSSDPDKWDETDYGQSTKYIFDLLLTESLNHHKKENIRFLCYNCFHNLRGNIRGRQPQWRAEQIKQARKKQKQQNKDK